MGTKIQADAVFSENRNVIDHNGKTNNDFGSLCDNRVIRNGPNPDWLISRTNENGYPICNIENLRLTMISQEAVFKSQVQELHRIFHRQRDLMSEKTMRDEINTPVHTIDSVANKHSEPSSLSVGLRSERTRSDHLFDGHAGPFRGRRSDEHYCAKSPMIFGSSLAVPSSDARNSVSESFWKRESIKRYAEMRNHLEPSPLNYNHFLQNLEFVGNGRAAKEKCAESRDPGNCKGGLPWFLKNTVHNGETRKEVENPYFMNLDSLRNCSEQFFTKSKTEIQSSTQKLDMSAPMDVNEIKKNEGDAKNQLKTTDLTNGSSLRYQIDLNLSLDDEDVVSAPSLGTAVAKTATAETGLKAPAVERDESAAQALVSISKMGNDSRNLTEAKSTDSLYWFAELISSQCVNSANESGEDSVPEGMDLFEYMTLKLEDVKEEHSSQKSSMVLDYKRKEKMVQDGTKCKAPRKRARQQKNFKRDVLPGIATLSRQDMKEDLKAFEEIISKGKGHSSKSKTSAKKGTGRKSTSPSSAVALPELRPVDGCLVEWGMKRTRTRR